MYLFHNSLIFESLNLIIKSTFTSMKNLLFLLYALFTFHTITAQNINFDLVFPTSDLQDADVGDMAMADIDNDGDLDILLTGKGGPVRTTLYANDGNGNFTEVIGDPFFDVFRSVVGFEDIDNDGDKDVLITGTTSSPVITANLYINDGTGSFSLASSQTIEPSESGDFDFGDIDGDGDADLIQTGWDSSGNGFVKLYTNNGSGVFAEQSGVPFITITDGDLRFIDIENDGDLDIIMTGNDASSGNPLTTLYTNNGSGTFSIVASTPFSNMSGGDIAIGDSDGDGDQDILLSGGITFSNIVTELYLNNGMGNFTLATGVSFLGTTFGESHFADFDNDGDEDVYLLGTGDGGLVTNSIVNVIYENLGSNNFILTDSLIGAYFSSAAIGDIDGDNDLDFAMGGTTTGNPSRITRLFFNNPMTEVNAILDDNCASLLPDPTPNNFRIQITPNCDYTAEILDANGIIFQALTDMRFGDQDFVVIETDRLPSGLFFIKLVNNVNGMVTIEKILKQ